MSHTPAPSVVPRAEAAPKPDPREWIDAALAEAAHLLPAQAPIEVFVHHNTLHAFQALPFHEAVARAGERFGARGYLSEDEYREALRTGRITDAELAEELAAVAGSGRLAPGAESTHHDGDVGPAWPPAEELLLAALRHGIEPVDDAELAWRISEEQLLERFAEEVPQNLRGQMLEATRRWLEAGARDGRSFEELVAALIGASAEVDS